MPGRLPDATAATTRGPTRGAAVRNPGDELFHPNDQRSRRDDPPVQYVESRERDVPIRLANSGYPSHEASTRLRTRSATAALSRRSEFALP